MAVAEQVKPIRRDELKARIDRREDVAIVEALPAEDFKEGHIPGALNIPPDKVYDLALSLLPVKTRTVVVYCADVGCHASTDTARQLVALGYTDVLHYAGGKADWVAAGLPLEKR